MTTKTKKIIFWAVIAALVLGMFLYLILATTGNVMMCGGIVVGWMAHVLYARYVNKIGK